MNSGKPSAAKCAICKHLHNATMRGGVLVLFCDLPDTESCHYVPRRGCSVIAWGGNWQPEELKLLAEEQNE